MSYFENYRAKHELFIAYCNFVHERATAHDAKICDAHDIQPWNEDAAELVDAKILEDHNEVAADRAYEERRELVSA